MVCAFVLVCSGEREGPGTPTTSVASPPPPAPTEPTIETIARNVAVGQLVGADDARIYFAGTDVQSVLAMPTDGGQPIRLALASAMMVEAVDGREAFGCAVPAPPDGACVLVRAPLSGGAAREVGRFDSWVRGSAALGAGVLDYRRADETVVEVSLTDGSTRVVAQHVGVAALAFGGGALSAAPLDCLRRFGPAGASELPARRVTALWADSTQLWFLQGPRLARIVHDRSVVQTVVAAASVSAPPPPGRIRLADSLVANGEYVFWTLDADWPNKTILRIRKPGSGG